MENSGNQRTRRKCEVEGCYKPHKGHGYCSMHLRRWEKHGDPLMTVNKPSKQPCFNGCEEISVCKGLCRRCYNQERRARNGPCQNPGCGNKAFSSSGLCRKCYTDIYENYYEHERDFNKAVIANRGRHSVEGLFMANPGVPGWGHLVNTEANY